MPTPQERKRLSESRIVARRTNRSGESVSICMRIRPKLVVGTRRCVPDGEFMKIFISHKSTDEEFVVEIAKAFRESDKALVEVFTSPNEQDAGNDYRAAIGAHLRDSDCVILLYTDETLQWDWSLYECGFFHGHHRDEFVVRAENDQPYKGRRLFIIHRKGMARPAPLENWDSIGVDTSNLGPILLDRLTPLQSFLDRLFFKTSFEVTQPIIRQDGSAKVEQLERLSTPIIEALRGHAQRPKKIAPAFAVEILGNAVWPGAGELPADTMITSDDRRAFEALGVDPLGSRAPWVDVRAKLKSRLENAWPFWSRAFATSLRDIVEERGVDSALPLLRKRKDQLGTWRPVFDEVSRKRDGTWIITILLSDVGTAIERLPKDELGSVTRLLWMERMFHYGIVQEYGRRFGELKDREEVGAESWRELVVEFRHAIDMVYAESINMGYNREDVANALNATQQRIYRKTIEAWTNCQALIETFAKESDPLQCWALCYDLFNKMQTMASNMYRVAGRRIATLAANVPEIFFPPSDPGNTPGESPPPSPVVPPQSPNDPSNGASTAKVEIGPAPGSQPGQ
jgi:TIR domain